MSEHNLEHNPDHNPGGYGQPSALDLSDDAGRPDPAPQVDQAPEQAPASTPSGEPQPDPVRDARDQLKLTEAEQAEQRRLSIGEAYEQMQAFSATVTQREWLLVCGALNVTREQLQASGALTILALAWVREKREHGGASWDRLLEMTDDQLLAVHGIVVTDEDAAAIAQGEDEQQAHGGLTVPQD